MMSVKAIHEKEAQRRALALGAGYRLISATKDHKLKSPRCPYCGGKLTFSINGCELDEKTGWIATELDINCDSEPDIGGDGWEDWWMSHSWDYCDKWHDVHENIVATLKRTHRVHHDNSADEGRAESAQPKPL